MSPSPEQPPNSEAAGTFFVLSSRFESRETSQAPYDAIQTIIHEQERVVDFSVYRIMQSWPESVAKAPPSIKQWYVVALGARPPEPLFAQVTEAINQGELAPLPDEAVHELINRRLQAIATGQPLYRKALCYFHAEKKPQQGQIETKDAAEITPSE